MSEAVKDQYNIVKETDHSEEPPLPYTPYNLDITKVTPITHFHPAYLEYVKIESGKLGKISVKVQAHSEDLLSSQKEENNDDESYHLPPGVDMKKQMIDGYYFCDKFDFSSALENKECGFSSDTPDMFYFGYKYNFKTFDMHENLDKLRVSDCVSIIVQYSSISSI